MISCISGCPPMDKRQFAWRSAWSTRLKAVSCKGAEQYKELSDISTKKVTDQQKKTHVITHNATMHRCEPAPVRQSFK